MWQIGFRHHYEEKSAAWESGGIYDAYNRGIEKDRIDIVISKTGFYDAINQYPEEQLHYPVESAVDEILLTAAQN